MTITKIIKKIASKPLESNGYNFLACEGGHRWVYRKTMSENTYLDIIYQKLIHQNALIIEFDIVNDGFGTFTNGNFLINRKDQVFWLYNNEFELENAVIELTNIALSEGIAFMDKGIKPIIRPPCDLSEDLYRKHDYHYECFLHNYLKFEFNENEVQVIDKIIESLQNESYESCRTEFLMIAAFFGELLKSLDKNLDWGYQDKKCLVVSRYSKFEPLFYVLNYWNSNFLHYSISHIYEGYKLVLKWK